MDMRLHILTSLAPRCVNADKDMSFRFQDQLPERVRGQDYETLVSWVCVVWRSSCALLLRSMALPADAHLGGVPATARTAAPNALGNLQRPNFGHSKEVGVQSKLAQMTSLPPGFLGNLACPPSATQDQAFRGVDAERPFGGEELWVPGVEVRLSVEVDDHLPSLLQIHADCRDVPSSCLHRVAAACCEGLYDLRIEVGVRVGFLLGGLLLVRWMHSDASI
mmetsp:Transcript_98969/g.206282  ORF Transcript_98969/g.206282 Transcript_98969/m.206282 type:complete len:221 (-) Transcript_98969:1433-2095(-)